MISPDAVDLIHSDMYRAGIRSDRELAARLGMKPNTLSDKLRGKTNITAAELSRIFMVTMAQPETVLAVMRGGFS